MCALNRYVEEKLTLRSRNLDLNWKLGTRADWTQLNDNIDNLKERKVTSQQTKGRIEWKELSSFDWAALFEKVGRRLYSGDIFTLISTTKFYL